MQRRVRLEIRGRVQGVAFRWHAREVAEQLGLAGYVRNLPDGNVVMEAEGAPELVEDMIRWARHGPPAARVLDLGVVELAPNGEEGFSIRH